MFNGIFGTRVITISWQETNFIRIISKCIHIYFAYGNSFIDSSLGPFNVSTILISIRNLFAIIINNSEASTESGTMLYAKWHYNQKPVDVAHMRCVGVHDKIMWPLCNVSLLHSYQTQTLIC